jgi:hypothetical protein
LAVQILQQVLCPNPLCNYQQQGSEAGLHPFSVEDLSSFPTIFLWLQVANNKILTRDNLAKRKKVDSMMCLFFDEQVSDICFLNDV